MTKEKHVFICGFPRSGTSLLYSLLASYVKNYNFFDREMSAAYILHLEGSYVTKRPFDCLDIKKIMDSNIRQKNLKCIFMIRDLRSIITSIHSSFPDDYFIGYESTYHVEENNFSKNDPGINKIFEAYKNIKGAKILKYEDLIKYPDKIQKELGEIFNFKYSDDFCNFSKKNKVPAFLNLSMNRVRKIDHSRLNSWKNHPKRIKEQFTSFPELFNILEELNYANNKEWFSEFEKTDPLLDEIRKAWKKIY